jgi:hypothetical protein
MKLFIFSLLTSTIFGRTIMLNKDLYSLNFENNDNFNMPNLNLEKFNIQYSNIQYEIDEELEEHTKKFIENNEYEDIEEIEIPMIFHVVYNNGNNYQLEPGHPFTINQQQIQKYVVDQLNKDYNLENEDRFETPEIWQNLMADFKINFFIKKVIFINSDLELHSNYIYDSPSLLQEVKFDKYGGSNVIDPELNLNVWIVNILPFEENPLNTLMGFAQFASDFQNHKGTDGYVLNIKSMIYTSHNIIDRTSTHELGHWMNLIHIWGNGKGEGDEDECDVDDAVEDTPNSNTNHIHCGDSENCTYPATSSCGSPDMFMNYMSYGHDMCMFTKGQMLRARAVFAEGGPRHSIVTQKKPDNSHDIFLIILSIAAIFSIVFLTCLIFRSLFKCLYLKYQLREMENLEEEIHNAEIP